jgi:hypothetical protein
MLLLQIILGYFAIKRKSIQITLMLQTGHLFSFLNQTSMHPE